MATIYLPTRMRSFADSKSSINVEGSDVKEVFAVLLKEYPKLESQIYDTTQNINRYTKVFINETDINQLEALQTKVSDRDSIYIIQAMAGG